MDRLCLHVLNVGQGDSLLLAFPDGRWAVIDCYKPPWAAQPPTVTFLEAHEPNLQRLAFVLLTHPDRDHYNGMLELLQYCVQKGIAVEYFIDTDSTTVPELLQYWQTLRVASEFEEENWIGLAGLYDFVRQQALPYRCACHPKRGLWQANIGDVEVRAMAPDRQELDAYHGQMIDRRERGQHPFANLHKNLLSVILRLDYAGRRLWLGADGERETWVRLSADDENCATPAWGIKVPHHGSRSNLEPGLWRELAAPDAHALISNGGNSPHPHEAVLEAILDRPERRAYCTNVGRVFAEPRIRQRFGLRNEVWGSLTRDGARREDRRATPETYRALAQDGAPQNVWLPLHGHCALTITSEGLVSVDPEFDVPPLQRTH